MTQVASASPREGRRRFLRWYLGGSAGALLAAILYPVLRFLTPPEMAEAATNEVEAGPTNDPELLEKGYKIVRFGVEPVILVRIDEGNYRAFSATCTHLDCIVEYQSGPRRLWCNCHGGEYDLNGRNVAGPPPRPLAPYRVDVASRGAGMPGMIIVSKA